MDEGPKRQQRAEETRQHLLGAARDVFRDRGYHGASVAAITQAAATAHGTFYLYFRNKEDVFGRVMTDMLDDLYRHALTPFEQVGDLFDPGRNRERIADFVRTFASEGRLWRALLEAALASPTIEDRWLAHRQRFHEGIAIRLHQYQEHGQLLDLDVDRAAYALSCMVEWYSFTGVAFDVPEPLEASDAVIDLLNGLWSRALGVGDPSAAT